MEAWFLADRETLQKFFGNGFNAAALPTRNDIENIPKVDIVAGLKHATQACGKGEYGKGKHSLDILAQLDPVKVTASSPYAKCLVDTLLDKARQTGTR